MVGPLRTPAVPPSLEHRPAALSSDELLAHVIRRLRSFPASTADQGRFTRVERQSWRPDRAQFDLEVSDPDGARAAVTVRWRSSEGLGFDCTCEREEACHHRYASLHHLYSELSAGADNDVVYPIETDAMSSEEPRELDPLGALDELLATAPSRPGDSTTTRIVWRVEPTGLDRRGELDLVVAPFEQSRASGREWSTGRRLSWQRFLSRPESWTQHADKMIAAIVRQAGLGGEVGAGYGSPWSVDAYDLLEELVAHEHVLLAADESSELDIVEVELGLTITTEEKGRFGLTPTAGGVPLDPGARWRSYRRGIVVFEMKASRALLAPATTAQLRLVEHLTRTKLTVPADTLGELLARLPALEAMLPTRLPDDLSSETIEGDRRIHVVLTPTTAGRLGVALRVRPQPESAWIVPGEGAPCVPASGCDRPTRVRRDLGDEIDAATRAAGHLGLTALDAASAWRDETRTHDETLDLLAAAGTLDAEQFPIAWPEGGEIRLAPRSLALGDLRVSISERSDLFDVEGVVRTDWAEVALAILLERIRSGARWVEVRPDEWARISDDLRDRLGRLDGLSWKRDRLAIGRCAAPAAFEALDGIPTDGCEPWKHLAQTFQSVEEDAVEPPRQLGATLRDYQRAGYAWMRRLSRLGIGACLADDMGLGKTMQTLAILLDRRALGPSLVVAPTSVCANWIRETKTFAPDLNAIDYRETDRRGSPRRFLRGDLVVISYGLLRREIDRLEQQRWATVVLDEAQCIKNSRSQLARAVLELDARWRLALSGTPIENHLGELWSLFRFLSPTFLGPWERFKKRFAEPIERERDVEASTRLSALVRPYVLRRTKSRVLSELPARTETVLRVPLHDEARRLYEDARLEALARLSRAGSGSADLRMDVLAALTKLRQIACHPALVSPDTKARSSKLEVLLDHLDCLREGGHQALVFSQFTTHLALIRRALVGAGYRVAYLDGSTPAKKRMSEVDAFQDGEHDVFLISLRAGGTGLNLTRADYVFHMDPWWNPAAEDQATDRAHRMGQKRPVTVYRLIAEDTIEERIQDLQSRKRTIAEDVLEGTDQVAQLSARELLDLMKRSVDAASEPKEVEDQEPV